MHPSGEMDSITARSAIGNGELFVRGGELDAVAGRELLSYPTIDAEAREPNKWIAQQYQ